MTTPDPELAAEQAYVDRAYEHLEEMRLAAVRGVESDVGINARAQEAIHQMFLSRLADLSEETALCFGRIDRVDGDVFYIGRRHVHDPNLDPVVIDWRAPVAEAFYQASRDDPWDLDRRRSFLAEGRRLLGLEDELFGEGAPARSAEAAGPLVRAGDALLAELGRERTGRMRDVAATIQAEQDRLIRADAAGILVIQGAPGTGKTAVGLHRAAYLLYAMRRELGRTGVLIVGPNRAFMRYVERVLPDLGETTVVQKAVEELAAVRAERHDPPEVVRLKGDPRMAALLDRALRLRTRPPARPVSMRVGLRSIEVSPADVAAVIERAHVEGMPYRERRDRFAMLLGEAIAGRVAAGADAGEAVAALSRDRTFRTLVDRSWPATTATDLVGEVLAGGPTLRAAAEGILDASEQRLLATRSSDLARRSAPASPFRPLSGPELKKVARPEPVRSDEGDRWSPADAVLIDEAQALITGVPRTYGHVIVDEAQDLSPMQLRMIARRAPSGSMTILGDVAQATGEWPHGTWDEVLDHLPVRRAGSRVAVLRIGYRVPAQILELANRLLPSISPDLEPAEPVRAHEPPTFERVPAGALVRSTVRAMEGAMTQRGTVGAIVPEAILDDVEDLARVQHVEVDAADHGRGRKVTLLSARQAKGLEFDHVLLAEPAAFLDDRGDGIRHLYVALTRATQTLHVLHERDVPGVLA